MQTIGNMIVLSNKLVKALHYWNYAIVAEAVCATSFCTSKKPVYNDSLSSGYFSLIWATTHRGITTRLYLPRGQPLWTITRNVLYARLRFKRLIKSSARYFCRAPSLLIIEAKISLLFVRLSSVIRCRRNKSRIITDEKMYEAENFMLIDLTMLWCSGKLKLIARSLIYMTITGTPPMK